MGCPTAAALRRYVAGDGDAGERRAIGEHVERCAACASVVQQAKGVATRIGIASSGASAARSVGESLPFAETGAGAPSMIGKYRIERVLGQGGMGAVYLAENVDIGRKVALKVLLAKLAGDSDVARRFQREARAAAAIGHPGIVDVLDFGLSDDGEPFIVMERLDGETLGSRLQRGVLEPGEAVEIAGQVLDALAAAHAKQIVHRDLKPENVFLCERPEKKVKILDFGISKFSDDDIVLTRTGTVMGTPLYMSPEQARDAKIIGPATDLYAVGALLYEALAGTPPVTGTSYNEIIANILTETPPSLASRRPGLSPALVAVVEQLLTKDPAARPADAATTKQMLLAALAGESPKPRSATTTAAAEPEPGARSRAIFWAAPLGVGLLAAGLYALRPSQRSTQSSAPAAVASTPAPTASTPAPAAPTPAKVTLTLRAEPASATWSIDGAALGCNPCSVTREQGASATATASAAGYRDERLPLSFDGSRTIETTLQRAAASPRPASKPASRPTASSAPPPTPPPPSSKPVQKGITIDKTDPF